MHQERATHDFKEVVNVTVRAKPYRHSSVKHLRYRGEPSSDLAVGQRHGHCFYLMLRQNIELRVCCLHYLGGQNILIQISEFLIDLDRRLAVFFPAPLRFEYALA